MTKTILITGASSGIGKATAELFQKKGWNVIASMRNLSQGADLAKLSGILVTQLDVTDLPSIQTAIAAGIAKFGKIDVLLNNAGYGAFGPLEAASSEAIKRQFDTNVIGLLETTKAILPHFRGNRAGVIVNVSSAVGKVTLPLSALYNGTKFAVEGISEALTYELAPIGITVKIIEPGMVKTDFSGRSMDVSIDESLTEYQAIVQKIFAAFGGMSSLASEPTVVAEVIYQAATDGTDQLRYTSGEDAKAMIAARKNQDDASFLQSIKSQFSL